MHIILPFVVLITGMLVTGYVCMFDPTTAGRSVGLGLVLGAAVLVGGMMTANLNGGKPYGLDVPLGVARWKTEVGRVVSPLPRAVGPVYEEKLKVPEDSGPPVA